MVTTTAPPITAITIQLKFPEFASTDSASIEFAIEEANLVFGTYSGRARDLALMYLVGHILAMSTISGDNGGLQISHETIGRLSQSFRGPSKDVDFGAYRSTTYGRRYLQLLQLGQPAFKTIGYHTRRRIEYSDWGFWW
jgi:hypothetical protein